VDLRPGHQPRVVVSWAPQAVNSRTWAKMLASFHPPGVEGARCAFKRLNCRFELLTTAVPAARVSNTRNRGS
jgi:hypothetical protein